MARLIYHFVGAGHTLLVFGESSVNSLLREIKAFSSSWVMSSQIPDMFIQLSSVYTVLCSEVKTDGACTANTDCGTGATCESETCACQGDVYTKDDSTNLCSQ